jgi:hypothetical protein
MKPVKSDRFICTEVSGGAFDSQICRVLIDRKTGVNYLWTTCGNAGGLTVLVDADGKPIVTAVPREEDEE